MTMNRRELLEAIGVATAGLALASGPADPESSASEDCQHDRLDAGEACTACDYVEPLPAPQLFADGATYEYRVRSTGSSNR